MEKITKIFEVNNELKSYTFPVIKILLCLVLFFILFNRDKLFPFADKHLSVVATILSLALVVICIFCTYVSIAEMIELHDRRVDNQRNIEKLDCKQYSIENIVSLIEKEDILEVQIKVQQEIVKIGCISDNNWSTNKFFDKVYYCDGTEYESIEAFRKVIHAYTTDGMLDVISIDGITQ